MKRYVAFFDLDNTILSASSGGLLFRYYYKCGYIHKKEVYIASFFSLLNRLGIVKTNTAIKIWIKKFRGQSEKTILDINEHFCSEILVKYIRDDIKKEIDYHKSNNGKTVMLSASLSFICNYVVSHLNMDEALCTSLEIKNGKFTGKMDGKFCYGEEKLNRAILYCREHGLSMEDSYYYADSYADIPLLEKVGYPVCVSPVRELENVAQKLGWRIIK
jgi:HAD superfamily hydrolase (TIGR01490 family)